MHDPRPIPDPNTNIAPKHDNQHMQMQMQMQMHTARATHHAGEEAGPLAVLADDGAQVRHEEGVLSNFERVHQ